LNRELLHVYGEIYDPRALSRLGWLAEVALTIHRAEGFPGGCVDRRGLEAFINRIPRPGSADDLGRPTDRETLPPVWLRWKIRYDADLATFRERAVYLNAMQKSGRADPGSVGP
jgi:hypothetical protein